MNTHPYIRAYLAGIAVPTLFVFCGFVVFCVERFVYNLDLPVERIIVFPLALVPNLWGVWNILYVALRHRRRLPLGMHGALLPLLLLPPAVAMAMKLNIGLPSFFPKLFVVALPGLLIVYYLVWKYAVRFLNGLLEVG
jgi:hypothetical protein